MECWIFGNPDLAIDSIPVLLLPKLQKEFPDYSFKHVDPLDNWALPEHLVIIDTIQGLKEVRVFDSLDAFSESPRVTMHDLDVYSELSLQMKLGKTKTIHIIGVPMGMNEDDAFRGVSSILRKF